MDHREPNEPPAGQQEAAWFAQISERLNAAWDSAQTPSVICERALQVVPAAQWCGITLRRRRGRLETVAVTDEVVGRWDALQYELDEGPCLEAARAEGSFLVRDALTDARWPRWGPRVAESGARSLISVQLVSPEDDDSSPVLGAINIYAGPANAFSDEDLDRAVIYAVHAGSALAAAQQISTLESAAQSRHHIGIAQGILMQRYDVTQEQAFDVLRRHSSHTNVKLRAVADAVIRHRGLPPGPDDA